MYFSFFPQCFFTFFYIVFCFFTSLFIFTELMYIQILLFWTNFVRIVVVITFFKNFIPCSWYGNHCHPILMLRNTNQNSVTWKYFFETVLTVGIRISLHLLAIAIVNIHGSQFRHSCIVEEHIRQWINLVDIIVF